MPNVAEEDTTVTTPLAAMSSMAAQGNLENANNWEDNLDGLLGLFEEDNAAEQAPSTS